MTSLKRLKGYSSRLHFFAKLLFPPDWRCSELELKMINKHKASTSKCAKAIISVLLFVVAIKLVFLTSYFLGHEIEGEFRKRFKFDEGLDFSSFAFGVAAAALGTAGVYLSLFYQPIAKEMWDALPRKLVPAPFSKWDEFELYMAIRKGRPDHLRTDVVKILSSLEIATRNWETLNPETRRSILGESGLGAERDHSDFGKEFENFQDHRDWLVIFSLCVAAVFIYVLTPVVWVTMGFLIVPTLITLYFICILIMILCVLKYIKRIDFLHTWDQKVAKFGTSIGVSLTEETADRVDGAVRDLEHTKL